jgi:hypothetical protein
VTAGDGLEAGSALLGLLSRQNDDQVTAELASVLVRLATTTRDRQLARHVLLGLLDRGVAAWPGPRPENTIARLAVTARDKRETSGALLRMLPAASDDPCKMAVLVRAVVQLAVTAESQRRVRKVVLGTLAGAPGWSAVELVDGLIQLRPERKDKAQARRAILAELTSTAGWPLAARLVDALSRLDPGVADLASWRTWEAPPSAELLAAARRNTRLAEWLAALPSLPSPI